MKVVLQSFKCLILSIFVAGLISLSLSPSARAATAEVTDADAAAHAEEQQVIQSFTSKKHEDSDEVKIPDEKKKLIMFVLGVPLLLLIITTVVLGIAMGVYGKPVYVAHMVCAGLSLTLALAHAVVGLVWFYPF